MRFFFEGQWTIKPYFQKRFQEIGLYRHFVQAYTSKTFFSDTLYVRRTRIIDQNFVIFQYPRTKMKTQTQSTDAINLRNLGHLEHNIRFSGHTINASYLKTKLQRKYITNPRIKANETIQYQKHSKPYWKFSNTLYNTRFSSLQRSYGLQKFKDYKYRRKNHHIRHKYVIKKSSVVCACATGNWLHFCYIYSILFCFSCNYINFFCFIPPQKSFNMA